MQEIDPKILENLEALKNDFILRCKTFYKISSTAGGLINFELNSAQLYLHEKLEEIKRKKGYVRAIIVKGRQQGITTYTTCRFLDRILFNNNIKVKLAAHSRDSVSELYKMVGVYYNNLPIELQRKKIVDNASSLIFDNGSEYSIATASNPDVFRGTTPQLVHLSEVSSYDKKIAPELMASLQPAVHRVDGTEIIIESTAKGRDNVYYDYCRKALEGNSEYELIFIPWFWQKEYREKDVSGLKLSEEDKVYQQNYGLDDGQMMWRQLTISSFSVSRKDEGYSAEDIFRHEYPATINEAFSTSFVSSFFDNNKLIQATIGEVPTQNYHKTIVGLDVAGSGKDRTVFSFRKGRHHFKTEIYKNYDTKAIIGRAIEIINEISGCVIIVDKGYNPAVWEGLVDRCGSDRIMGIHFGQSADNPNKFANKRAEIYYRLREWVEDYPVKIEDDAELINELLAIDRKPPDVNGRLCLISKEEIKNKIGVSTDKADALALTFGYLFPTYDEMFKEEEDEEIYYNGRDSITGY